MRQFVAVESSSGHLIHVAAIDEEAAYREIGIALYGMNPVEIDTGNIDVELYEIFPSQRSMARYLDVPDDQAAKK